VTGEERLRNTFLFVIGEEVPVGLDVPLACPGVVGLEDVNGVDGFVTEVAGPISWTLRNAVKMSSSVKRLNGSRLLRIVPVNSVGS